LRSAVLTPGGIAALLLATGLGAWFVDDAGIAFAFARSFATGLGPVAYAGGPPVEGFSSPTWVVLLAVAAAAGFSIPMAAKALGALTLLTSLAGARALMARLGWTSHQRMDALGFLGLSGPLVLWCMSGLETGLLAALMVWSIAVRTPWVAGVLLAATITTRPEAPLLVAGLLVARHRLHGGPHASTLWWPLAALTALVAWRVGTFGVWVPQTAPAKLTQPLTTRTIAGALYLAQSGLWIGAPAMLTGALVGRQHAPGRLALRVALPVVVTAVAAVLFMGGDWMRYGRFTAPLLPILTATTIPSLTRRSWRPTGATLLWVSVLIGQGAVALDVLRRPPLPLSLISEVAVLTESLGRDGCERPSVRVAAPDVGGLLWSTPSVAVLDLAGLTTPRPDQTPWPDMLRSAQIDVVVVHGPWARRTGLTPSVMSQGGFKKLCQRPPTRGPSEAETPAVIYAARRCTAPLSPRVQAALDGWCARPR